MRDTLSAPPHGPAWAGLRLPPANSLFWQRDPLALLSTVAMWGERKRFRRKLEQMSKNIPHLLDDTGITRREAEAEIAKMFWQR